MLIFLDDPKTRKPKDPYVSYLLYPDLPTRHLVKPLGCVKKDNLIVTVYLTSYLLNKFISFPSLKSYIGMYQCDKLLTFILVTHFYKLKLIKDSTISHLALNSLSPLKLEGK